MISRFEFKSKLDPVDQVNYLHDELNISYEDIINLMISWDSSSVRDALQQVGDNLDEQNFLPDQKPHL